METKYFPLIAKGDISHIEADCIVYSTGCFISFGFLTNSLLKRYGRDLQNFLREHLQVGNRPKGLPRRNHRTKGDVDYIESAGGLEISTAYFIPAEPLRQLVGADPKAPPLVVAIAGGEYIGHVTPHSIEVLVENVFAEIAANTPHEKTQVVVFPTMGIGGGGLGEDRLPAISSQIAAMHRGHIKHPNIFPVLLAYSDIVHHLALTARTQIFRQHYGEEYIPQVFTDFSQNSILKLQDDLNAQRLVAFAGAGISVNSGLPSWRDLVCSLADAAGIVPPQEDTVEQLLETAEQSRSQLQHNFANSLQHALGMRQDHLPLPSITHYLITTLPIRMFVTTNYDDLLERALQHSKQVAFTIHSPEDVARSPIGKQINVLKMHGDFTVADEVVLSKTDYDNYFEKRPAVSALLRGLLLNRTFLFLGYSLRDPNLQIIIDEVSSLLQQAKRPAYAIVFEASADEITHWKQRGVYLLVVRGETISEKNMHLWQFLDSLQLKYFSSHRTWLAEDAKELLPKKQGKRLESILDNLRKSICDLANELNHTNDISDELATFIQSWMLLAGEHGLKFPSALWKCLATKFAEKQPKSESNLLQALYSQVEAFKTSEGREEDKYKKFLDEIEQQLHRH